MLIVRVGAQTQTFSLLQHLKWDGGNWVGQKPHFRGPFHFSEPQLAGHGPSCGSLSFQCPAPWRTLIHESPEVPDSVPWVSGIPLRVQPRVKSGSKPEAIV